jgi:hypothetical protein
MAVLVPLYLLAVVAAVAAAAAAAFYAALSTPGALTRMQRALRARQQVAEARRARARARAAARAAAAPQPQPLPSRQRIAISYVPQTARSAREGAALAVASGEEAQVAATVEEERAP